MNEEIQLGSTFFLLVEKSLELLRNSISEDAQLLLPQVNPSLFSLNMLGVSSKIEKLQEYKDFAHVIESSKKFSQNVGNLIGTETHRSELTISQMASSMILNYVLKNGFQYDKKHACEFYQLIKSLFVDNEIILHCQGTILGLEFFFDQEKIELNDIIIKKNSVIQSLTIQSSVIAPTSYFFTMTFKSAKIIGNSAKKPKRRIEEEVSKKVKELLLMLRLQRRGSIGLTDVWLEQSFAGKSAVPHYGISNHHFMSTFTYGLLNQDIEKIKNMWNKFSKIKFSSFLNTAIN